MGSRNICWVGLALLVGGCSKQENTNTSTPASPPALVRGDSAPTADKPAVVSTNADKLVAASQKALSNVTPEVAVTRSTTVTPVPDGAVTPAPSQAPPNFSLANLTTDQATQGLKEALGKGLQQAVATLGQSGGFLTNMSVKIPLPAKLQPVEKTLRAIGQGNLADQCIITMNHAAEQAVPVASQVFADSLKQMSIQDAKGILSGSGDSATQFFRRSTEADLTQKFLPIVQQSMMKCGATAAYEQLLGKAKVASPFFDNSAFDINAYVTHQAMDGLFKMVAEEEKSIRENPVARSTDLLKTVFGNTQK